MTILNDKQVQLLETVRTTYNDVIPILKKMEEDYEYAVYRAKKPIRDAVDAATDGDVPLSRIVSEATDLTYPQKLRIWLRPSDDLLDRLVGDDVPLQASETYAENLDSIETASRSPHTGAFTVTYGGSDYTVPAMGPDAEPWATREEDIPEGVYELIATKFPGFVVLDEDDD